MGPPKTRAQHLLAQRGRFHEGSMNDRVSAVPPVAFLGEQEREAFERSAQFEHAAAPLNPAYFGKHEEKPQQPQQVAPQQVRKPATKMNIFGQVWEGVRGKLRLRKDADDKQRVREEKRVRQTNDAGEDEKPSRDEVFANYQQLVASGFFSSHAIQSTRHGPPPGHRPSTSHGPKHANHPPQWPLGLAPHTPKGHSKPSQVPLSQTIRSPVSAASSRGTKRAAAESPTSSANDEEDEERDDGEDESTLAHRFLPKRLRKSASRDISLPKLRSVASRKNMRAAVAAARRSISTGAHYAEGKPEREPNKLTKRAPWAQQMQSGGVPLTRASLDVVPKGRTSGDAYGSVTRRIKRPTSARNLRSGIREVDEAEARGLKVVPDANRGIPSVPDIPAKFTYGEDRENGVPWRGLRR